MITLSIPLLMVNLLNLSFSFIDTMTIGQFDIKGVSAISAATAPITIMLQLIGVMMIGVQIMAPRAIREKNKSALASIYKTSFLQMATVTIALVVIGLIFQNDIIHFYSTDDIFQEAKLFYIIRLLSFFFLPFILLIKTSFEVKKQTSIGVYLVMITGIVNFLSDMILIYWFQLGVLGSAIGTFLSVVAGFLFLLYKNQKEKQIQFLRLLQSSSEEKEIVHTFSKISISESINMFFDYFGISVISVFVTYIGTLELATNKILSLFFSLVFALSQSIAYAYLIYRGSHDKNEKHLFIKSYGLSLLIVSPIVVLSIFFPKFCLLLFSVSSDFLNGSIAPLRLQAFLFLLIPLVTLSTATLRSMKLVVENTVISIFATWAIRIPLAYYFIVISPKGIIAIVLSTAGYILARIVLNYAVIVKYVRRQG